MPRDKDVYFAKLAEKPSCTEPTFDVPFQYSYMFVSFLLNLAMWGKPSAMTRWPTIWRLWVMMAQSFLLKNATCCPWPTRTQWDLVVLPGASFQVSSRRRSPKEMRSRPAMPRTTVSRSRTSCRRFAIPSWSSWIRASSQRPHKQSPRRTMSCFVHAFYFPIRPSWLMFGKMQSCHHV